MALNLLSRDDVFISYSRQDGALYAAGLADKLTGKGLSCFVDKLGTEPNHDLPNSLRKKIRNCTVFVLVGTPKAARSEFVGKEISEFRKTKRVILPVDFGRSVGTADWYQLIPGIAAEPEGNPEALGTGDPSPNVLNFIEKSFRYTRRNQRMFRMFLTALSVFLILAAVSVVAFFVARNQVARAAAATKLAGEKTEEARRAVALAGEKTKEANAATQLARQKTDEAGQATELAVKKTAEADAATVLAAEQTELANEATARAKQQELIAFQNRLRAEAQERLAVSNARRAEQRLGNSLVVAGDTLAMSGEWEDAKTSFADAFDVYERLGLPPLFALQGMWNAYRRSPPPLSSFGEETLYVEGADLAPGGGLVARVSHPRKWEEREAGEFLPPSSAPMRLYDAINGRELLQFPKEADRVRRLVFVDDAQIVTGGDDNKVMVWDAASGSVLRTYDSHVGWVASLAVSENKTLLLTGKERDEDVAVLKLDTGELVHRLDPYPLDGRPTGDGSTSRDASEIAYTDPVVNSPRFVADDTFVAAGYVNIRAKKFYARYWKVATGEQYGAAPYLHREVPLTGEIGAFSAAFSSDGRLALLGSEGGTVTLANIETGEVKTWDFRRGEQGVYVRSVAFSDDGRLAIAGNDEGRVRVWDVSAGLELYTYTGLGRAVRHVDFSKDGRLAFSADNDGRLNVLPVQSGIEPLVLPAGTAPDPRVAFSPDGRLLLTAGVGTDTKLWDTETGLLLRSFEWQAGTVRGATFSADGSLAAVLRRGEAEPATCEVWDVATGKSLKAARLDLGAHCATLKVEGAPAGGDVLAQCGDSLRFTSTDGARLMASVTDALYVEPGADENGAGNIVFSADLTLAVGVNSFGEVQVAAPKKRSSYTFKALEGEGQAKSNDESPNYVERLALSPDNRTALIGSSYGGLRLWDLENKRRLHTLIDRGLTLTSLVFSPDGQTALSSTGQELVIWNITTGRRVHSFARGVGAPESATFSHLGHLAFYEGQGSVKLLNFPMMARLRKLESSVQAARLSLQADPENASALHVLGDWYASRGFLEVGTDLLERTRRVVPSAVSSVKLGHYRWKMGDAAAARREFEEAARRREAPDAYLTLWLRALSEK